MSAVYLADTLSADIEAARARRAPGPLVLGICGCQGSGKSSLALALKQRFEAVGARAAVLSLDDLYLSAAARRRLAQEAHPLLRTRGAPGTHDVALGIDVINRLTAAGSGDVLLPRFDKGADEPLPRSAWETCAAPPGLIIFEGWCLGARPQCLSELHEPINELEWTEDADGAWRRHVNAFLAGAYQRLFGLIDHLILLRAPDFNVVFDWRRQQENELRARRGGDARAAMNDAELRRFIMHYERLTRHILSDADFPADVIVELRPDRSVNTIRARPSPGQSASGA